MAKNKYTQLGNILAGADATGGGAANANRARSGADRRADILGEALLEAAAPVLMDPEVLKTLPEHIRKGVSNGDPRAVIEATMYIGRSRGAPQSIPRDRALQPFPGPGGEAGFQMGAHGGRVPTDSAGELILSGPRGLKRNPGAEAGFQMGGSIPPQNFDQTGLSAIGPNFISIRTPQRQSPRGANPLMAGGAAAAAGLGGYAAGNSAGGPAVNYIADLLGDPVDVVPESRTDGAPGAVLQRKKAMPATNTLHNPIAEEADRRVSQREGAVPEQPKFEYGDTDPMKTTYDTLLDAGVDPRRAEGIARGRLSMTQMEYDAVIRNGGPRRQRMQDQIDRRRDARMRGY